MKKFKCLFLVVLSVMFLFTGCTPSETATHNLKTDAESFKLYRKITAINLRTDQVLFEIEGYFNYENEDDGDLSIVMEVGKDKYERHVVGLTEGTTFVVQQMESSEFSPYSYKIRIFAAYPDVSIGQ